MSRWPDIEKALVSHIRAETGGKREVIVQGQTVRDLLDDLTVRFPGLNGQLQYANVYVGGEDIRTREGYETPVAESDTVILLPAMAGGQDEGLSLGV